MLFEELLESGCFGPHPPAFAGVGSVLRVTVWDVLDCLGLHPLALVVLALPALDMEALPQVEMLGSLGLHPLAPEEEGLLIELLKSFGGAWTDSLLFVDDTLFKEEELFVEAALGCLELHPPP